jgi:adenosine deaminase
MNETVDAHSARFAAALRDGDLAALALVPKGDLHVHALCGGSRSEYEAWCGRSFPEPPAVFPDFVDFDRYLLETLAEPYLGKEGMELWEFFKFFFVNTLEKAIADGVTVIEPSLDSSTLQVFGGDAGLMVEAVGLCLQEALSRHPGGSLELRPELGMAKGIPIGLIEEWVPRALATGFFTSIDLYGDERVGNDEDYVPFYEMARERGMRLKAHAGEFRDARSVRRAVELFGLDAVQHGVAAADDPECLEFLARRGVTLNMCPTSNVMLGRARAIKDHPIREIFRFGVPVTVNTDDRIIFGASLSEEYLALYREGTLAADELDAIRRRSLAPVTR